MFNLQSSTDYEQKDITQSRNCKKDAPENSHVVIWFNYVSYNFKKSAIISDEKTIYCSEDYI